MSRNSAGRSSSDGDRSRHTDYGPTAGTGRTMLAALAATAIAGLPIALLGALVVLIRQERSISALELGSFVSLFFASSAVFALPSAWLSSAIGAAMTVRLGSAVTALVLVGIASFPWSFVMLLVMAALAGASHGAIQLSVNYLLATRMPERHRGFAFGLKQATVPAGPIIAGVLVATFGVVWGWRAALLAGSLLAAGALILSGWHDGGPRQHPPPRRVSGRGRYPLGLVVLATAVSVCSAAGNSLAPFLVTFAVDKGFRVDEAAGLLSVGGICAAVVRGVLGWLADRLKRGFGLVTVAAMMAIGGAGFFLLSYGPGRGGLIVGVIVCFGAGWGWPGLLWLSVARIDRFSVRNMALVQFGAAAGSIAGPSVLGVAASQGWLSVGWQLAAVACAAAALLTLMANALLQVETQRRKE